MSTLAAAPLTEQVIFDRHPLIFRDHTKSEMESCMHWGLEIGPGWYPIIDAMCETLTQPFTGSCNTEEDGSQEGFRYTFPQVVADQAKEKFGGLRFYYHLEPDAAFEEQSKRFPKTAASLMARFQGYTDGVIALAEVLCGRTCEVTGAPGRMYIRGGWYKTLCYEEAVKQGYYTIEEARRQRTEWDKERAAEAAAKAAAEDGHIKS